MANLNPNAHAHGFPPQPGGAPARIPPAPPLAGEARLHACTHHSFRLAGAAPLDASDPYGDHARLIQLGGRMLAWAYAQAVCAGVPGTALQAHIDATFPAFVDRWVTAYEWRRLVYGRPEGTNLNNPAESQKIFEAYAGAVVAQPDLGPQVLVAWIEQLVKTP